jgi:hypothetical protein
VEELVKTRVRVVRRHTTARQTVNGYEAVDEK